MLEVFWLAKLWGLLHTRIPKVLHDNSDRTALDRISSSIHYAAMGIQAEKSLT